MKHKAIFLFILISLAALISLEAQTDQKNQKWDGSRTTPVHQIPLKDEFDQPILPSEPYPLPYSARYSCAPCHDYTLIQEGWHFNAASSSQHGRTGEPWVWVEPKTGTVLPLSYRSWERMWNPQQLGLTPWDFTLLFGRHMSGGGMAEPRSDETSPESRWNVSGKLEINCMGCHNASRMQSHSEWAKQVLRHNFRWAATAASGFGEVGGMASRLPGTWDIYDGPNPDDTEWAVVPSIRYRPEIFDSKHRVFFDIANKPDDLRCLVCHSVYPVGTKKYSIKEDIHSAAGMKCVDCHRNDISHAMIRGYEGEAEESQNSEIADFTCRGCHIGEDLSRRGGSTSGRLGAPYPKHSGIPAVHFEKLSCTVCHSGPVPSKNFNRVRTSRANRLGIYGVAQWFTELPHIIEPVFVRDRTGKITPHRLMWPAFWGEREGDTIKLLKPAEVEEAAGDILASEENIAEVLTAFTLYSGIEGIPALVASGKVYELNVDRRLDASLYPGEEVPSEILWVIKINGEIAPLIPEFDPEAEEPDVDTETRIQKALESLATISDSPGQPALIHKDAMYMVVEGYLDKTESPGKTVNTPQLCWFHENKTQPIVSEFDVRTAVATVGEEHTLTEEQVERVLKSLSSLENPQESGAAKKFFYVSGGKMFQLDEAGNLFAADHAAAEPVIWPLAHQVRPAQQSLGIKDCTDCHTEGSVFFFNSMTGDGPLLTKKVAVRSAHSLMGLDKPYQKLFGLSFRIRPAFKVALFISALIVGSMLLLGVLLALARFTGLIEKRRQP
ncbi:MAG: hypothetical protein E3J22_09005 [Candidatus Aminicenantes bacterium]|nr:MAG: hypothetical protein E3J22_09005 [Candidatus Aminicenantes bacterium]